MIHLLHFFKIQARSLDVMDSACPGLFSKTKKITNCEVSPSHLGEIVFLQPALLSILERSPRELL